MKKKLVCVLVIVLCLTASVCADLGSPTIQAVCRVTLVNGKSYEGLIVVGKGGYEGIWMNGFYFEGDYGGPFFFTLRFNRLVRNSDSSYQSFDTDGQKIELNSQGKPARLYFLEKADYAGPTELRVNEGHEAYLVKRTEIKYKMLSTLTIFTELPEYLYLPNLGDENFERSKKITIPLDQIFSFELLRQPQKKWLNHIAKKRKGGCAVQACEDYMEPVWYHEISRLDEEAQKNIREDIESNLQKWRRDY